MVALEYNMDLSRLKVIEFDNNSIINEKVNIRFQNRGLNSTKNLFFLK